MSDTDISSLNNSTDDPEYNIEQESVESSSNYSSSSDDDFVKPPNKKAKKKSPPAMAASDQATSSASPGGYFNLTQIVEEHSQAAVAFRKPFDDLRPGRFLFVSKDVKITRTKELAMKDLNGFVLIFSTTEDWTHFCEEAVDPSVSPDRVYREHSSVPRMDGDEAYKFDKLIWVNQDSMMAEIQMEVWYKLLEAYHNGNTGINLRKSFGDNSAASSATDGGEKSKDSPPTRAPEKPQSSKFNFKLVGEDTSDFIERNMSASTNKVTRVAVSLFNKFMFQVHPELLHSTLDTAEEFRLPSLLSEFIKVLQKDEGESYNATTLQAYYLGLARYLRQKRDIVLKDNPKFDQCRAVLSRQQKISCENGQRPGLNKSHAIPPEVLAQGWSSGAFGSSSPKSLIAALLIHLGPGFGIRGKAELSEITNEDLIPGPRRQDGVLTNLRFSERKTKTRSGVNGQGARKIEPILYPDDSRPDRCPIRLYELYQSKKPKEMQESKVRFFLSCKNTRKDWSEVDIWYASQPMGRHTIASLVVKQIESKNIDTQGLKLTGVSTRKTGIDGALSSGMPPSYVACLAGQKSLASQTHYMSPTDSTLKATSRMMHNVVNGESAGSSSFGEILAEEKTVEANRIATIKTSAAAEIPEPVLASNDVQEEAAAPPPPLTVSKEKDAPKHDSKRSKSKRSKKKRKHRRRSPSSSSSSSCSSSTPSDSSTSSSEDDARALKRKMKKMKRKMRRERRRTKENRPPVPMYLPMMMPVQGLPFLNNNVSAVPQFQSGVSGQVMSQITQHTVAKATHGSHSHGQNCSHGNNHSNFLNDEIN